MLEIMKQVYWKFRKLIPMPVKRMIINQQFNRHYRRSYSQYGEDLIICDFFQRYFDIKGNYLDIGAFHPKKISNTHILHTIGWRGTVIDLDDFKLKLFKRNRKVKVDTLARVVVPGFLDQSETYSVYKFKKPFSEIDTFVRQVAEEIKSSSGLEFLEDKIQAVGINNLLKEQKFNFVNIDVEGVDEDLILSLDFENINLPELIVFESWKPMSNSQSIVNLENNGYVHLFTSGGSMGYFLKSSINNEQSII
jgi:hypothetical protein